MTPEERIAFEKRRARRNWAMLAVLIGLVLLFYLVTIAKRGG
jgi:peptidoglycan/LPS O-acetylase OafA/YrhL